MITLPHSKQSVTIPPELSDRLTVVQEMIATCSLIAAEHEANATLAKRRLNSYHHELEILLARKRAIR